MSFIPITRFRTPKLRNSEVITKHKLREREVVISLFDFGVSLSPKL
jgi:hypothetical protein